MVSVAVAIVVGLISSFVQSLGLTIQRKSHVQEDLLPLISRRKQFKRPLWLIGFIIYITSNIFSTIFQLDALPIIILAPLGAVSLIFNALLARVILGDTFGRMAMVGTGLVTGGAILIAVFGVVEEREHGLEELMVLWKRGPFLAFFSILLAAVVFTLVSAHIAVWHVQKQLKSGRIKLAGDETPPGSDMPSNYGSPQSSPPIPFRKTSALSRTNRKWSPHTRSYATFAESPEDDTQQETLPHDTDSSTLKAPAVRFADSPHNLTIDLPEPRFEFTVTSEHQQRTLTLSGLAFAAASGTLSGMSLVLAKAAVELLVISIDHYRTGKGSNQFTRPESWFLVLGLGIGAVLQLVYLNYSLTFASPALICPLAFCFFNLSSIFDGLVFYDQFSRLQTHQIALVSIGVGVLLLGVWVVALIKPTGEGGVDVGTWVEEVESGSECFDEDIDERDGLLGGSQYTEPEETIFDHPSSLPHAQPGVPSPSLPYSPRMSSPRIPGGPFSPTRRRSRGPRYGTLLPEYGSGNIAPTGFSIGIGAASPGFVLRSETHQGPEHGHPHRRRSRTMSEGQTGVIRPDFRRADTHEGAQSEAVEEAVDDVEQDRTEDRRRSWLSGLLGSRDGRLRLSLDGGRVGRRRAGSESHGQ